VWALLLGPLVGLFSSGYIRLVGWVAQHRVSGRKALVAPLAAFAVLGLVRLAYPQLFGNGKNMAHDVFLGGGGLGCCWRCSSSNRA